MCSDVQFSPTTDEMAVVTVICLFVSLSLSLSNFNGHFPGGPVLAGTRMSPFWVLLEVVVTTGAVRRAKFQLNCHHQQINAQFFYRLDSFYVVQPVVSRH